jgi:hypothetical protein
MMTSSQACVNLWLALEIKTLLSVSPTGSQSNSATAGEDGNLW